MVTHEATIAALIRANLPPCQYTAFTRVLFDGLTETEVAAELSQVLSIPVSRSMVHRAKHAAISSVRREATR